LVAPWEMLDLIERDAERARGALAPDLQLRLAAGPDCRDKARQVALRLHRLAVDLDDDVAYLHARALGGAAFFHRVDQRAARPVDAARRGDRSWTRNWILFTMFFGTAFIVLHGMEWSKLIDEGMTPFKNPWSSGIVDISVPSGVENQGLPKIQLPTRKTCAQSEPIISILPARARAILGGSR
jgi:hypothetical protein